MNTEARSKDLQSLINDNVDPTIIRMFLLDWLEEDPELKMTLQGLGYETTTDGGIIIGSLSLFRNTAM